MKKYFDGLKFGMMLQIIIGPVCLLVFNTSQNSGFLVAFTSVIAVTLVDTLFILLANIGATSLLKKEKNQKLLKIIGSIVLMIFGLNIVLSVFGITIIPGFKLNPNSSNAFLQAFILSISNPIPIVFWGSVLTTKLIEEKYNKKELIIFSIGLISSTFFALTGFALFGTILSSFIPTSISNIISVVVGIVIIGFGIKMFRKK